MKIKFTRLGTKIWSPNDVLDGLHCSPPQCPLNVKVSKSWSVRRLVGGQGRTQKMEKQSLKTNSGTHAQPRVHRQLGSFRSELEGQGDVGEVLLEALVKEISFLQEGVPASAYALWGSPQKGHEANMRWGS